MRPVEGALLAVQHHLGLGVFPLQAFSKRPPAGSWKDRITTDTSWIADYATANSTANWALATGGTLLVLDIDPRHGGDDSLRDLLAAHGPLPPTWRNSTPSNGTHLLFSVPQGQAKNSAGLLGPGLDTRGDGGYIVWAGSVLQDERGDHVGEWEATEILPVAPCPQWILERLHADTKRPLEYDTQGLVEINSGSRNEDLYTLLCRARSLGLGDAALEALANTVNETQTDVPLDDDEVSIIIRQVLKFAPGDSRREAKAREMFAPIQMQLENNSLATPAWTVPIHALQPKRWLARSLFARGFITALGSAAGLGKSRVCMLQDIAVATGRSDICGFEIAEPCPVWAVTEDPEDDMLERYHGQCQRLGIDPASVPIHLTSMMKTPLRLTIRDGNSVALNRPLIDAMIQYALANHIGLIRIDPYANMHSGVENSNDDGSIACEALRMIIDATDCAISVVHHTAKGLREKGLLRGNLDAFRGASSLTAAIRIAYTLDFYNKKLDSQYAVAPGQERTHVVLHLAKGNILPSDLLQPIWYTIDSERLPCHKHPQDSVGVATLGPPPAAVQASPEDELATLQDCVANAMGDIPRKGTRPLASIIRKDELYEPLFREGAIFSGLDVEKLRGRISRLKPFTRNGLKFYVEGGTVYQEKYELCDTEDLDYDPYQ